MTPNMTPKMKIVAYALVRDVEGKPLIDGDPHDLHVSIREALTDEEFEAACAAYDDSQRKE